MHSGPRRRARAPSSHFSVETLEARQFLSAADESPRRATPAADEGSDLPAVSAAPVGLSPQDLARAYNLTQLVLPGNAVATGAAQTIAIIDAFDDPSLVNSTDPNFLLSDLHRFDQEFGLPDPPSFQKLNQSGSPSNYPAYRSDWALETAMDVEWAHALAPQANIVLIEAGDDSAANLYQAVLLARQLSNVSVVSMSWTFPEDEFEFFTDSHFTTPRGQTNGISFVAAAGDTPTGGYPAFSPNVLAVGGTSFSDTNEVAWPNGGAGSSLYEPKPVYQSPLSSTKRTIPDVSMIADANTGVPVLDTSATGLGSADSWHLSGGTSLACALWASVIAIVDQDRAIQHLPSLDGATQLLPRLYSLPSSDFNASGPMTGLGSPRADLLISDLAGLTISGTIFHDTNRNGVQNKNDHGVPRIRVFLDTNDNGVHDLDEPLTRTDRLGHYSFPNQLASISHTVCILPPKGQTAFAGVAIAMPSLPADSICNFCLIPLNRRRSATTPLLKTP